MQVMTRWMNSVKAAPTAIRWKKITKTKRRKRKRKCREANRDPSRSRLLLHNPEAEVVGPSPHARLRRKSRRRRPPKRSQQKRKRLARPQPERRLRRSHPEARRNHRVKADSVAVSDLSSVVFDLEPRHSPRLLICDKAPISCPAPLPGI